VDDRRPAVALVASMIRETRERRLEFARKVFAALEDGDEDTRWKCGHVVEELVLWDPKLVPMELLEVMARDELFSVRSSAAVSLYHLARLDPVSVPLDSLLELASPKEDWYVFTPATSALLRLARSRPVVLDELVRQLSAADYESREHAAEAFSRLAEVDWDLVPDLALQTMAPSQDAALRDNAVRCRLAMTRAKAKSPPRDYSPF